MKINKVFLLKVVCAIIIALSSSAYASDPIVIKVQPLDDYVYNYDRSGGSIYKTTDKNASPNCASYYYDSGYGFGSILQSNYTGMTFDISSLPTEFTSAIFSFNLLSTNCGYGSEVGCAKLTHNGTEILRISTQPLGWINVDVTSYLFADKAAGNTSTFNMDYVANGYGSSGMTFSSGESAEFAPRLTVASVPEPSSLLALASGAMALGGFAIRRRRS